MPPQSWAQHRDFIRALETHYYGAFLSHEEITASPEPYVNNNVQQVDIKVKNMKFQLIAERYFQNKTQIHQ